MNGAPADEVKKFVENNFPEILTNYSPSQKYPGVFFAHCERHPTSGVPYRRLLTKLGARPRTSAEAEIWRRDEGRPHRVQPVQCFLGRRPRPPSPRTLSPPSAPHQKRTSTRIPSRHRHSSKCYIITSAHIRTSRLRAQRTLGTLVATRSIRRPTSSRPSGLFEKEKSNGWPSARPRVGLCCTGWWARLASAGRQPRLKNAVGEEGSRASHNT